MKLLKEHPLIALALVLIGIACFSHVKSSKAVPLTNYEKTHEVFINDGNTEIKSYYVHATTVEEVLNDLHMTLNDEDSLNFEEDYHLQANDVLEITRVTYEEERIQVPVKFETVYVESSDPSLVGVKLINNGTDGIKDIIYTVKKCNGNEIGREETNSEITTEPIPCTFEVGSTTTGYVFTGPLTSYGADCVGCGTRTAAGLYVTIVGVKNEPKATLSFNGGEYYVLAADRQFPFGTIVKVSNHSYGIPDPFYGIVLDRGGGVKGTHMDLYTGSQRTPLFGGHGGTVTFEIIAYGDGRTSIY